MTFSFHFTCSVYWPENSVAHMPPASAYAVPLALSVSRAPPLSNEHPFIPFNLTSLGRTPWTDKSKLIFHVTVFSWIPYIDFVRLLFSKCLHYPMIECFELVCLASLAINRRYSDGMTWSLPWEKIEFSGRDRPVSNYDKLECDKHWDRRQQREAFGLELGEDRKFGKTVPRMRLECVGVTYCVSFLLAVFRGFLVPTE